MALTALRDQSLDTFSAEAFEQEKRERRMGQAMLNHYLATGQRLPLAAAIATIAKR